MARRRPKRDVPTARIEWHGIGELVAPTRPPGAVERVERLRDAVRRIGASEAFVYLLDHDHLEMVSDRPIGRASGPLLASTVATVDLSSTTPGQLGEVREDPSLIVSIDETETMTAAIDLVAARVTAISGHPGEVRRLASSILSAVNEVHVGLRRIITVGAGLEALAVEAATALRVDHVADADRAIEFVRDLFASHDLATQVSLVVVGRDVVDRDGDWLVRSFAQHRGIALVFLSSHPSAHLVVSPTRDRLEVFIRRPLVADRPAPRARKTQPTAMPVGPIEVAVLGPIEVRGITASVTRRPKIIELIAYLAMHRAGSVSRLWTAALWPDRAVPAQTISNRLSETRQILGIAGDGLPRLRRNGDRHLLSDVTTDWERFQGLARSDAPEDWSTALALVRGRPFEDLRQGHWVTLEGFSAEIEEAVVSVALRFGDAALLFEDPDRTATAARQALRVAPFDERLHRLLMRCAHANGNRGGIDGVLRQLAVAFEIDGDPLSSVHPETAALYRELVAPRSQRALH